MNDPVLYQACTTKWRMFLANPSNPELNHKELDDYPGVWSIRITRHRWRACYREGDRPDLGQAIIWFFLGTHGEFDEEFERRR
ncbi:MAG: hypothetical protein HY719_04985 [Planctomycetes bacterium]|nr:hypothetical protein [Planctomycetota bacterium]